MNAEKRLNDFKAFCTVLHKDPKTSTSYIKIPCQDYTDLELMRYYLINAIHLLSNVQEYEIVNPEEFGYTLHHLTRILKATSLGSEVEGLDNLLKD